MALHITDLTITSNRTEHTAISDHGLWWVSWFPHLGPFNRNQAITALCVAEEIIHGGVDHPGHRLWPMVTNWCAELYIGPQDAVEMLKSVEPPG